MSLYPSESHSQSPSLSLSLGVTISSPPRLSLALSLFLPLSHTETRTQCTYIHIQYVWTKCCFKYKTLSNAQTHKTRRLIYMYTLAGCMNTCKTSKHKHTHTHLFSRSVPICSKTPPPNPPCSFLCFWDSTISASPGKATPPAHTQTHRDTHSHLFERDHSNLFFWQFYSREHTPTARSAGSHIADEGHVRLQNKGLSVRLDSVKCGLCLRTFSRYQKWLLFFRVGTACDRDSKMFWHNV